MADDSQASGSPPPAPASAGSPTSLTLLARLRDNEQDAWSFAVHLYTPLVHQWCARAGVPGTDREDLSQEVFGAAATGLRNFRRDRPGDTFRGWLYGITRHILLRHFERRGRSPQAPGGTDAYLRLQEVPESVAETSADDIRNDKHLLYRRALELVKGQFEEKTWQAFWLTVIDGLAPDDVAGRLGLTAAAVRKYKSRVLHRLKTELGEVIE